MARDEAPAWMLCEDMITRLKDELVLEAVDILHEEMKAGRVDIEGYVSLLPDKPNELQRDMYIIKNLVEREGEIIETYAPFLIGAEGEGDPKKVSRKEELEKFILSVRAISTLIRLSGIAGTWAEDTGKCPDAKGIEEILIKTVRMNEDRVEVLDFVLGSSRFSKSEALTKNELGMLIRTRKAIPQRP